MFIRKNIIVFNFAIILLVALSTSANSATSFMTENNSIVKSDCQTVQLAMRRGGGRVRREGEFHSSFNRPESYSGYMTHGSRYNPPRFHTDQDRLYNNDSIHRTNVRNNRQVNVNTTNVNVNNHPNRAVIPPNRITHEYHDRYPYHYPNWHPYHYHDGDYWRGFWHGYNYRYPYGVALTTALVTIPLTAIAVSAVSKPDVKYYYNEGVYYVQSPQGYVVTQPPSGVVVNSLPDGMLPVSVNDDNYYYYFGTFYHKNAEGMFVVVNAPYGATVPYIPNGFKELDVDGKQILQAFNTYYVAQQQGENTVFTVVDPNYI